MALRAEDWKKFFQEAGIPEVQAKGYTKTFVENRISHPNELTREMLKELGVVAIGDAMAIARHAKTETKRTEPRYKPQIALPKVTAEMTTAEFRKFKVDWSVYRSITQIPEDQVAPQLYTACEPGVQNSLLNTEPNFLTQDETTNLAVIEKIVTRLSNPAVHRLTFSNLTQSTGETIQAYVVRLKSAAKDCEFECPNCQHDISDINIKDQLIRGVHNTSLQTDILAKSGHLKTLEEITRHAGAFEAAVRDQTKISDSSTHEIMRFEGKTRQRPSQQQTSFRFGAPRGAQQQQECKGCGNKEHGQGNSNRPLQCPAWSKKCSNCGRMGHFAKVCFRKQRAEHFSEEEDVLVANVEDEKGMYTARPTASHTQEIPAIITPKGLKATKTLIFPDSGAGICLAGTEHMNELNISTEDLIRCSKKVMAVGGSTLTCRGWLPVNFKIGAMETQQPLYFCEKVDRIYFSRKGCTAVNILPPSFPYPMKETKPATPMAAFNAPTNKPEGLPCAATQENIERLKDHLIRSFSTVFEKSKPFKAMKCKEVHIHLKEN